LGTPVDDAVIFVHVVQTGRNAYELHGELDFAASSAVLDRLSHADGDGDLELDCSALEFIDASGLRVLVKIDEQCRRSGGRLVLVNPARCVVRLLELTRLDGLLAVRSAPTSA
jgi:anti-anti-sigma factor